MAEAGITAATWAMLVYLAGFFGMIAWGVWYSSRNKIGRGLEWWVLCYAGALSWPIIVLLMIAGKVGGDYG